MLTILKGLPLSYYKDLQDDKEIVFKSNDILYLLMEHSNRNMGYIDLTGKFPSKAARGRQYPYCVPL